MPETNATTSRLEDQHARARHALGGRVAVLVNGLDQADPAREGENELIARAVTLAGGTLVNDPRGKHIREQIDDLRNAEMDLVIALGGDGTINAGARLAVAGNAPLLILPAGTMNLVAKDLHLPIDPRAILDAADTLAVLDIDYASVNDELFLHSALIGLVPAMSRHREELRTADDLGEALWSIPSLIRVAFESEEIDLRLVASKGSSDRRTRSVAVSNNPLSENGATPHSRSSVDAGTLGVYASAHEGPLASLKLLASLGTGSLARDPETLSTSCQSLAIHAEARTIPVAIDGEVVELEPPLHFRSHPRALRVAIPAACIGAVPPPDSESGAQA